MAFFRRALAVFLALNLSIPGAFAGEIIKPQVPTEPAPVAPKAGLPTAIPTLPEGLPQTVVPTVPQAPETPVLSSLQNAAPPETPGQAPKSGELSSAEAGKPFTGAVAAPSVAAVAEPPAAVSLAPSRASLLDVYNANKADRISLRKKTAVAWVQSWALIISAPFAIGPIVEAFTDGRLSQHGAQAIFAAAAALGVYLMAKVASVTIRTRAAEANREVLVRELTKDRHARTAEQAVERLKDLDNEAARHALATRVEPQFAELFAALKNYGAPEPKLAKDMDHLQNFLKEVRSGERAHWTTGSMTYHLLAGSDDALDALRRAVWSDRGAGIPQVMGLEEHILKLRRELSTDHQPGYHPARELRFAAARMDEAYATIPAGVDLRLKGLVDLQLRRLEREELRDGRAKSAARVRALRASFLEELSAVGGPGLNDAFALNLAAANRARVESMIKSLAD
jgi:hypothetical protein